MRRIATDASGLLARIGFVAALVAVSGAWAAEPTYSAALADGTYIAGGRLQDWRDTSAQPKLDDVALFDPQRPVRWLRLDEAEPAARPVAFVEFCTGDRLPGRVTGYSRGRGLAERLPPHLLVAPLTPVDFPDQQPRIAVRVRLENLRRIVWRRHAIDAFSPCTLFYADGHAVRFRSLRWAEGSVTVLLADGPRRVPFGDIAELHLPQVDNWSAYYSDLAMLDPDLGSRLIQVETGDGLVATTSLAVFQARATDSDRQHWYHMLYPAWSLDSLWIRHATIVCRRFWDPREAPLSIIAPRRVVEQPLLGRGYHWQANANVHGDPLRSGGKAYGWGIGTHAACRWECELPAIATAFRTSIALDEAAGHGGCARGLIYMNDVQSPPLFETSHLIGAQAMVDTGPIALGGAGGQRTLILKSDPAHEGRPPGADPFDIRDHLDWLEPTVSLDAQLLAQEVQSRVSQSVVAWDGWTVSLEPRDSQPEPARLKLVNRWKGHDPLRGDLRRDVATGGATLRLARQGRIPAGQNYLAITTSRQPGAPASRIQARAAGELIASFSPPERGDDPPAEARLVPLAKFAGQNIELEVRQIPQSENSQLEWSLVDFQERQTPLAWRSLRILEATSAGGATMARQPDESLLATERNSDFDEYTLTAESDLRGVTAFRLDVLADPRLPNKGPGRATDGAFRLSDFSITAAPAGKPQLAEPVLLASASASWGDHECGAANAIDPDRDATAWCISQRPGQNHCAIFTAQSDIGFAATTRYTFVLRQHRQPHSNIGRLRLSVTDAPRPVATERLGLVLPTLTPGVLTVFEDSLDLATELREGQGLAKMECGERFSGDYCLRVEGRGRSNARLPDLWAKIREAPGPDEFRFLRFAWKKFEGRSIGLGVAHDGVFSSSGQAKFRYHAGPGGPLFDGSVEVSADLPRDWTVVTRDLFADFGAFNFTGFSPAAIDGQYALFDHVLLGRTVQDLDAVR